MMSWSHVIPASKTGQEKLLAELMKHMHGSGEQGKKPERTTKGKQTDRRPQRPEWKCKECATNNWDNRLNCRQCGAACPSAVQHGKKTVQEPKKPMPADKPRDRSSDHDKTQNGDVTMDGEDSSANGDAFVDPSWREMSVQQLKTEATKMVALQKQLKDNRLQVACDELGSRLQSLRSYMRSKLSNGQRLDTLEASLRKQRALYDSLKQQKLDTEKKLEELQDRMAEVDTKEKEILAELEEAKKELIQDTLPDSPLDSGSTQVQRTLEAVCQEFQSALPNAADVQVKTEMMGIVKSALGAFATRILPPPAVIALPPSPVMEGGAQEMEATQKATSLEIAAAQQQQALELPQEYGAVPRAASKLSGPYLAATNPKGGASGTA